MTYIIAEIGINHNGDIAKAGEMISKAKLAGANCVKFQKRTPDICVPEQQKSVMRETPWGNMTYLDYKKKIEFGKKEYDQINTYCKEVGIEWTASVWDIPSLEFMQQYNVPFIKIPSALITDIPLVEAIAATKHNVIMSTGMSNMDEIRKAGEILWNNLTGILLCNSSYPAEENELDIRALDMLNKYFYMPRHKVGNSGQEKNVFPSLIAVARGAEIIERHVTLDNNMWGTDQKASLNMSNFGYMIDMIRKTEIILGDTEIKIYPGEQKAKDRLRK